ncbi:cupredoxin domain-containing protein [Candidatus Woesearchaeota archaeon]|nr:cupredoxin domain-containing protein [Candidatus Woesearchaeota archaeon]
MRALAIAVILTLGIALIAAGCASKPPQTVVLPPVNEVQAPPVVKDINMSAFQWGFNPSEIVVNKGEKVRLFITSSDVNHGFNLPEYNIDVHLSPKRTVLVEFTADKAGTFKAYCSVYCGDGHPNMKASIIVKG